MDCGRGRGRGRARHTRGRSSPMGWSPRANVQSKHPHSPVVRDGQSGSSWPVKDGRESSQQTSGGNVVGCHLEQNSLDAVGSSEERNHTVALESAFEKDIQSSSDQSVSNDSDGKTAASGGVRNRGTLLFDVSIKLNIISGMQSETELPLRPSDPDGHSESKNSKNKNGHKTGSSEQPELVDPFDVCPPKESGTVILKPPLLVKNREKRNEIKHSMGIKSSGNVLRPGMVLLKGYISLSDQVKIVKRCRDLGLSSGGFYQPGYREGTKLHLKMMCLGKDWDPQTSEYGDHRQFDGAKPPNIPTEFHQLIEKAIRDSHVLVEQDSKTKNPEKIVPWMSPDICIVNFYSQNGRLGLHQDKDESEESLRQGLPVVSISVGDSAEFLYGDERDDEKAQKVKLESGDVLIFGGRSRNIFHGVSVIHPNTAPKLLLGETNLRTGRLNLTFRQY